MIRSRLSRNAFANAVFIGHATSICGLSDGHITRKDILEAVDGYELIESYPEDKYLPSYLLLDTSPAAGFHVLFAADVEGDNVRMVTAYRPDLDEWELGTRRGRP
jgi:hypothetical protein